MTMSLYASAEGVLYRSYDNYIGQAGFYDGTEQENQSQSFFNSAGHQVGNFKLAFLYAIP